MASDDIERNDRAKALLRALGLHVPRSGPLGFAEEQLWIITAHDAETRATLRADLERSHAAAIARARVEALVDCADSLERDTQENDRSAGRYFANWIRERYVSEARLAAPAPDEGELLTDRGSDISLVVRDAPDEGACQCITPAMRRNAKEKLDAIKARLGYVTNGEVSGLTRDLGDPELARDVLHLIQHVEIGYDLDEEPAPDEGAENVCEHGDHPAPTGKRFCSPDCESCEVADCDPGEECAGLCDLRARWPAPRILRAGERPDRIGAILTKEAAQVHGKLLGESGPLGRLLERYNEATARTFAQCRECHGTGTAFRGYPEECPWCDGTGHHDETANGSGQ